MSICSQAQQFDSLIGASFSGIFIKLDSVDYNTKEIVHYFFGNCEELGKDIYSVDTRRDKNILITRQRNGIMISNSNFANKAIIDGDLDLIKNIYEYFQSPETIFCFYAYDTSMAAGFRYIKNGKTVRFKFETSFDIVQEFGNPLPPELKILNGSYFSDPSYKELLLLKPNDEAYRTVEYDSLTITLAQMVMNDLVGYDLLDESQWLEMTCFVKK